MILTELLRFKPSQKYFLLDFETEGLNLFYSRPWQASFITFTLNDILEQEDFHIWWQDLRVSAGAARKTNFNYNLYQSKAVEPKIVCDRIDEYMYNPEYIPVWHNGLGFDSKIHQTLRRLCGKPFDISYLERSLDTDALSRAYLKGIPPDKNNFLAWQIKMSGIIEKGKNGIRSNLAAMGREFKIHFEEEKLHDANIDKMLNMEVARNLIRRMDI